MIYYIDFVNGDDDLNDGLSIESPWKTLPKYTTVTVRSAGDIAKVRANQTHTYSADIKFDEDGDQDNPIEVRGCSSADDPWGDGSDVKPIISFGGLSFQVKMSNRLYWKLKRLDIQNGSDSQGLFSLSAYGFLGEDLDIHGHTSSVFGSGIQVNHGEDVELRNCSFYSNRYVSLKVIDSGKVYLNGCTFDGGADTTKYGIFTVFPCRVYARDCSFGLTTTHSYADVNLQHGGIFEGLNVTLNSATKVQITQNGGCARIEDYGGTEGVNRAWYYHGIIEKDTDITRIGGAPSSAKVSPNTHCGANLPLTLAYDLLQGDFPVWCPTGETTITIYIRSLGIWTAYPTASELYITAEHWDGATAKRVESPHSTQVLTDEATWVAFTTTFTPSTAGWVYVKVYLKKYEEDKGIYVDVKPVVS